MDTVSTTTTRHSGSYLTELQNAARAGQREARAIGEDLTRYGRVRMDIFQTERRLKSAYSSLGEVVYKNLAELRDVDMNDGHVIELVAHIRYYQDELARLRASAMAVTDVF